MHPGPHHLRPLSLVLILALSGCGGGGGGGSSGPDTWQGPIAIAFNPSSIEVRTVAPYNDDLVPLKAAVTNLPPETVYPRITIDKPVFETGNIVVVENADGTYGGHLQVLLSLAPGTYSGTVTLQLCKDQNCKSQFPTTGETLPYSVTIEEPLKLSTVVDGPSFDASYAIQIPTGGAFHITSDTPVTWKKGSVRAPADYSVAESTPTRLSGTVTGTLGSSVCVQAVSIQTPKNIAGVCFEIAAF